MPNLSGGSNYHMTSGDEPTLRQQSYASERSYPDKKDTRKEVNLREVAEVLVSHGLDPTEEITKILMEQRPVRTRTGVQVLNEDGTPMMEYVLDTETRLKTFLGLMEYVKPKLKSTELKVSGNLDLTADQLDARIAMLLNRVKGGKDATDS
jgi:hypothetical protein